MMSAHKGTQEVRKVFYRIFISLLLGVMYGLGFVAEIMQSMSSENRYIVIFV